jgi:hypothetical protein
MLVTGPLLLDDLQLVEVAEVGSQDSREGRLVIRSGCPDDSPSRPAR